jgi:hypothetical protein
MNINELIGAIQNGEHDQDLRRIEEACKHRMKRATANKLGVGAIVQAKNLRPKYICGQPAIVERVNSETVSVEFDPPVRRGHKVWRKCRLPLSCVEVIAPARTASTV